MSNLNHIKKNLNTDTKIIPQYLYETDHNNNKIRKIIPYYETFNTYAKGRWLNKKLYDIFTKEFGSNTPLYWKKAIQTGKILVNNNKVSLDYIIKNNDFITHYSHRHEPPVYNQLELVGYNENLVGINKPSSIPMHPCGAYKYNSLENIIKYDKELNEIMLKNSIDYNSLYIMHRLDRVTSGLVILARNKDTARIVSEKIRLKETKKIYFARIKGKFPNNLTKLKKFTSINFNNFLDDNEIIDSSNTNNTTNTSSTGSNTVTTKKRKYELNSQNNLQITSCTFEDLQNSPEVGYYHEIKDNKEYYWVQCPIGVISHRDGIHACTPKSKLYSYYNNLEKKLKNNNEEEVNDNNDIKVDDEEGLGKPCLSRFLFLGYDEESDTSLVECVPYTGRTHQLRLHLSECLQAPIANDPCYGGELFYNDEENKSRALSIVEKLKEKNQLSSLSKLPHIEKVLGINIDEFKNDNQEEEEEEEDIDDDKNKNEKKEESDENKEEIICRYCKIGEEISTLEHYLHCNSIWLHAYQYSCDDWSFNTPIPSWAQLFLKDQDYSP